MLVKESLYSSIFAPRFDLGHNGEYGAPQGNGQVAQLSTVDDLDGDSAG
jgi:hypothetical protein